MNVYFCCTSGISISKSVNFFIWPNPTQLIYRTVWNNASDFYIDFKSAFSTVPTFPLRSSFLISHCFLLNRHKSPIYTRLFLQRRGVFLCILDFKTVETIKKSAQFQFLLRNGYKIAQVIFFFNAKEYKLFGGNVRFSAV